VTAPSGRRDRGAVAVLLAVVAVVVVLVLTCCVSLVLLAAITGKGLASGPPGGCGTAGTGRRFSGVALDAAQLGNAATITRVVAGRSLPSRAAVIAVATAYQESGLRNLTHGDAAGPDSAGLFQQRPSAGWGTRSQVLDPVHATGAFLDRLTRVPDWPVLPLTEAAQLVQNSALPTAYARWEPLATDVVAHLWPSARSGSGVPGPARLCPEPADTGTGTGTGAGTAGTGMTRLPPGFEITGSPTARIAVRYAVAQLGKPYRWAATGPDAFDCSGLTMRAWSAAGVALEHFTGSQVHAGTPQPLNLSGAVGGDLVFVPGTDGTRKVPGHVGMIAGSVPARAGQNAVLYLVQAPSTGRPVQLTPVTAWTGRIVAVRHLA
jgi:cell wall-associated NlpC family hydrolase